jgi:hypothetical protein
LVVSYGGWAWAPAVDGSKRHALMCARLGGKWIKHDTEMSGRVHFLKLEHKRKAIMTKKWQQLTKYHNGDSMCVKVEDARGDAGNPSKKRVVSEVTKPPEKSEKKPKDATKPCNTAFQDLVPKGLAMKKEHNKVMQKADQLCMQIIENPDYIWAQNPQNQGILKELVDSFRAQLTPFDKEMLLLEWGRIKIKYSDAQLYANLKEFISKDDYKKIEKRVELILRRHKA